MGGDGAVVGEELTRELGGVGGVEVVEGDDARDTGARRLLEGFELFTGVDVDEVPPLDVAEPVDVEDGVEGFVEGDAVEVRGDGGLDGVGGDDVPLGLDGEELEDVAQVLVVHVEIDEVVFVDPDGAFEGGEVFLAVRVIELLVFVVGVVVPGILLGLLIGLLGERLEEPESSGLGFVLREGGAGAAGDTRDDDRGGQDTRDGAGQDRAAGIVRLHGYHPRACD